MTRAEKVLYHQIHPLKLLTDFATSFASTWLLWQREWGLAAAVGFLPSLVMTALVLWLADLEPYRRSVLGRYLAGFMTRRVEALRLVGQLVMWGGAVSHVPWLIPLGLAIVVYGWLKGLFLPQPEPSPSRPYTRGS